MAGLWRTQKFVQDDEPGRDGRGCEVDGAQAKPPADQSIEAHILHVT